MFKKLQNVVTDKILLITIFFMTLSARADLPTPPAADTPTGNNDWIDVGATMGYKTIGYALVGVGAMILLGGAFGIFKAYATSQEKQDTGHFFKHTVVSIAAIAIGGALTYYGYAKVLPQGT